MTDHADTVRRFVDDQRRHSFYPDERDLAALTALLAERQQAVDERDEALQRMDEALAKQYAALQSYEAKIQDLAQETLRNSELRERCDVLSGEVVEWKLEAERSKWPKEDAQEFFRLRHDYPLLEARCQQAIDALREIGTDCEMASILAEIGRPEKNCQEAYERVEWCDQCIALAALLSLGEQAVSGDVNAAAEHRQPAVAVSGSTMPKDSARYMVELELENARLKVVLAQAHEDLEAIQPPRGHEDLAQGVYFAFQRLDKAMDEINP